MLSTVMVSNNDKWVRIFDIPDISKHKKGFTIYKIISLLYPESCPDAVTKLTVWKRFNDFKKLHRELKLLHKHLTLKDKYPPLPQTSFFKRFDEEIVQERRQNILLFLEYIASNSQLFTSTQFVKFFESGHTPIDQLNSNINLIRADLNLPDDPEFIVANSDDEQGISDSDSVTTFNSLSLGQSTDAPDGALSKSKSSLNTSLTLSQHSKNSDTMSISTNADSIILLDGQIYPTPPNTPGYPNNYVQYIIDASMHVNMAIELENNNKFEEAFTAYKIAIDILLKNGKDEKDYERKQMVRYKTEKYLIKAERIYNMYLSSEVRSLHELTEEDKIESIIQRPISDLYKYKVVQVFSSGMLVIHLDLQKFFYVKVIYKSVKFFNDNLVLPENVPFMTKLYNYYNCENALFLILEYCRGPKLWDYINNRPELENKIFFQRDILDQVHNIDISDVESEASYSDLVSDYTLNKNRESSNSIEESGGDDLFSKENTEHRPQSSTYLKDDSVEDLVNGEEALIVRQDSEISERSSIYDVDVRSMCLVNMDDIIKWSAQLIIALNKLHTLGIICCDLQSHNILINEDGDLVLTYMCNVNDLSDVYGNLNMFPLAPEIYSFEPITEAIDWWCFGVVLYELLVGIPLSVMHPDGITTSTLLKIPRYVSPEGRSLLRQLLMYDPQQRLGVGINGIDNLKAHPFFTTVKWQDFIDKFNN